jgi:two-component system OmpR family sensor kinase
MFNSLRSRLIVSYIAIIAVCLAFIAVALALLLRSNPISRQLTQEQLIVALDNAAPTLQQDLKENKSVEQIMADLRTRFDLQATRVMLVTGAARRIVADSGDSLVGRDLGEFTLGLPLRRQAGLQTGVINLGESEPWVYALRQATGVRTVGIVVAQAPQNIALRSPIYVQVLRQLALAGCIGGVLSVLLALLISWSVASPLRHLAKAAQAVAEGNYDHRVTVEGPTEVQELARNFDLMAEQVQASRQSQRDFLANVSHDLKTPLTSIQGFAQAITDGAAGDPDSIRHSASVIQDEAQRMSRMVTELLDLARIESGQIVMRREPVQVSAVLRDCVDKFALRAQQCGVKLDLRQTPNDPAVISGDGDRLAQVFNNLLDNALKHTPSGGKVTVAARSLAGSSIVRRGKAWPAGVEVSVSDTGSGIPPEDLSHIFERFYQVDKSRQRSGGLGLGLAIVKQIVEAHHGIVQAESVVGIGSRFTVTLPLDSGAEITQASPRKR